ncbi:hypothetical protein RSOLAG22IIIB_02700 [Rhizoctonia solani]|uniref:SET domain-containing protein n=1 Tax=Rhizoctonia solani TaxID=456999 RepID=A0A0K6GHV0_9AGAM|nr:unnamed protein product [Rhizoctonia solani]CUA78085.1 hypothetical protein RSOLAG22IIIB_02700 [Rhizoctonia solani]
MSINPDELIQYPELLKVNAKPGERNSGLLALKHFKAGEVITYLTGTTPTNYSWSSVRFGVGSDDHVELNSVLVYVNHSCSPNAAFDISSLDKAKWNFRALRDIQPGEELTYFYPSTEWHMDGFQCWCGEKNCLGWPRGSQVLSREDIVERGRGFINTHISTLLDQRDNLRN